MTISAYIVRHDEGKWKCLVHFHKKIEVLMQVGGHIELDETPWQTVAHELAEETGYALSELDVLQYTNYRPQEAGNVTHPTPLLVNTHNVGNEHYHSDLCYAFAAENVPETTVGDSESADLRWLTVDELRSGAQAGEVLQDVVYIYEFLLRHIETLVRVDATSYSLDKPPSIGMSYKRGAPGES